MPTTTTLFRHGLTFGDEEYQASFVRAAHPGDPYQGADDDGVVDVFTLDVAPFRDALGAVVHQYPNPERDALYDAMWQAAETAVRTAGHTVAGTMLPVYVPPPDLPSTAEIAARRAFAESMLAALPQG